MPIPLAAIIMTPQITLGLILISFLYGCSQREESSDKTKVKVKLAYEVIPEDYDRKMYYLDWQDTLGKGEGYLPNKVFKRPKEIWCVITSKNKDTLGYYTGLSTAQTFVYFETKDTIVILNFKIGLNMFSEIFDNDKERKKYWDANKNSIEFKPIEFNVKADLRRKFEVELIEK